MASRKGQYLLEEKLLLHLGTGTGDQGTLYQLSHSMWNEIVLLQPAMLVSLGTRAALDVSAMQTYIKD